MPIITRLNTPEAIDCCVEATAFVMAESPFVSFILAPDKIVAHIKPDLL